MHHSRTVILILLFAILTSMTAAHAAGHPFEGYWRSASGTIVQVQGNQGVIISTTAPAWQDDLNQVTIKNIRPSGSNWIAEELVYTDTNQDVWLTVDWRYIDDRIVRTYQYDGTANETYFTRIPADQVPPAASSVNVPAPTEMLLPVHAWQLGISLSHIKYEEPDLMEEKGFMFGFNAAYAYHRQAMLKAELGVSLGTVDYTSPISGEINGIPNTMVELRGLAGYDFNVSTSTILTPYTGLGYRYLRDDSSGKVSNLGAAGYLREANYFYSPIGLALYSGLNSIWSLDAALEYDLFWRGLQKSHLSDANLGFSDIENEQNSGYGLRAMFNLRYAIDNLTYVFGPFVRYWDIDDSEVEPVYRNGLLWGTGYEPANTSLEVGFNLAVLF
jgi:hypothetical protein